MIAQISSQPIISVGRWIAVATLEILIIRLKTIRIIPNIVYFLSFFCIHQSKLAIAILIETAAWSDGKLLEGK